MQKLSGKIAKFSLLLGVIVLCGVVAALIMSGISQFKIGSQLAGINQVSHLSHLLVRQQAKLFSLMLVRNTEKESLSEALDAFAKEDFVLDAQLYHHNGELIARSQHASLFNPLAPRQNTQQIVEPILAQHRLIGFLRVTFDTQYAQTTQHKINELFHLLYGKLVILFLAGGLCISCFYAFRHRRPPHSPPPQRLKPLNPKTQGQRFHSRRRAFRRK